MFVANGGRQMFAAPCKCGVRLMAKTATGCPMVCFMIIITGLEKDRLALTRPAHQENSRTSRELVHACLRIV